MKVRRAKPKPPPRAACECPPSIANRHRPECPRFGAPQWEARVQFGGSASSATEPTRVGSATVQAVPFEGVAPLVTLDDPAAPPEAARGAFARLRPPDDHPPGETASWAGLVRAQAIAARVVPRTRRREALLPNEARPTPAADVRAEATALAAATNDPEVAALVEEILSEVERSNG